MGRKNTNFRKLYLVDENHYNSLQYGQVHDRHLKDVKSLFETLNFPQPPPTQNATPLQQDQPINVDSQNNNMPDTSDVSMQSLSNSPNNARGQAQTLQSTQTNNPLPIPIFAPQPQTLQSTQTNLPLGFPGFVQNAHRPSPLGTTVQRIPAGTIPGLNYGPPLIPRPISGQTNQNNAFAPATTSSPVSVIRPLGQPTSVIQTTNALPGPPDTRALAGPPVYRAITGPAASQQQAVALPPSSMVVDPHRGRRRARSSVEGNDSRSLRRRTSTSPIRGGPVTVGDNGSPIIGAVRSRRRVRSPSPPDTRALAGPPVYRAITGPAASQQQAVALPPSSMVVDPHRGRRRARSSVEGNDSRSLRRRTSTSPIRGGPVTVGDNGSPIIGAVRSRRRVRSPSRRRDEDRSRSRTASPELGARRRNYQRVVIDPTADFLRQTSVNTRRPRPDIVWFTCQICDTSFRSEQALRRHVERMHREDLEQTERGEKRDRGDEEYGRNDKKYKRVG